MKRKNENAHQIRKKIPSMSGHVNFSKVGAQQHSNLLVIQTALRSFFTSEFRHRDFPEPPS